MLAARDHLIVCDDFRKARFAGVIMVLLLVLLGQSAVAAEDQTGVPDDAGTGQGPDQPPRTDGVLELDNVPPSPASVPGERIWPDPHFTHWPYIAYTDEERNCAFQLPVKRPSVAGTIAWRGGDPLSFVLPDDPEVESISGLVDVPMDPGVHTATVTIGAEKTELPLRLIGVGDPWPHAGLRAGFPVDADGVPIILLTKRRDWDLERRYAMFKPQLPRPTGEPLLVGDRLEALGASPWDGLEAERRPIDAIRYPHHAALVALADLPDPLPRTLVWSPGNNVIRQRAWTEEETRLLEVIYKRCELAGVMPRLVLILPPVPVNRDVRKEAETRRKSLRKAALRLQWRVIDVDRVCGPAEEANQVSPGLYTTYPVPRAQSALRDRLAETLRP